MKKPYLREWYFIRMSDGHPYDKLAAIKAVFNEIQEKGSFNALNVDGGLGIIGKRKVDEMDSDRIQMKILRLKKCSEGILVTTECYDELLIAEEEMKNMFKIFRESRKLAEIAAKRAAEAEGAVLKARAEKKAAEAAAPELPPEAKKSPNLIGVPQEYLGKVINL